MRGIGAIPELQEAIPTEIQPFFMIGTYLGYFAFFFGAVSLYYLYQPKRRKGIFVLTAVIAAMAVGVFLKNVFGLPRPPSGLQQTSASGFAFPSNHALISTTLFFGLAAASDLWTRRTRYGLVSLIVAFIAISRIAVGAHFLVDIVAGIGVGLLIVYLTRRYLESTETTGGALGITAIDLGVFPDISGDKVGIVLGTSLYLFVIHRFISIGAEKLGSMKKLSPRSINFILGIPVIFVAVYIHESFYGKQTVSFVTIFLGVLAILYIPSISQIVYRKIR
ncbi:MAG: phosphatase PAP2 family protein [Halobacteria archaeon]